MTKPPVSAEGLPKQKELNMTDFTRSLRSDQSNDRARFSSRVVSVTPALAQHWLNLNTANRPIKPGQIAAFAADMQANRWAMNGQGITFAGPDHAPEKLLDGQNRLHAIVKSGVTVTMLVSFGVAATAQSTMDSGAKRTVADNLAIAGIANGPIVAAASAIAMKVASGHIHHGSLNITNVAVEEFIFDNLTSLSHAAEVSAKYARKTDVKHSLVAYTHFVLAGINEDDATAFWRDASDKLGLAYGDPVIALTNKFAEARRSKTQIPLPGALSSIYRAWNNRREGKPMLMVKVNSSAGGLIPIPLPV